jgi:hypothetical protein
MRSPVPHYSAKVSLLTDGVAVLVFLSDIAVPGPGNTHRFKQYGDRIRTLQVVEPVKHFLGHWADRGLPLPRQHLTDPLSRGPNSLFVL